MFKMKSNRTKSIILGLVLSFAALFTVGCIRMMVNGPRDSWEGVVKHIRPATVKVIVGDLKKDTEKPFVVGTGSGFLISSDGLIVTASHVVDHIDELWKPWVNQ